MWTIFKVSIGFVTYNMVSVFCFGFLGPEACSLLAPWPRIKLASSTLEGQVLTTGPPGKCLTDSWVLLISRARLPKPETTQEYSPTLSHLPLLLLGVEPWICFQDATSGRTTLLRTQAWHSNMGHLPFHATHEKISRKSFHSRILTLTSTSKSIFLVTHSPKFQTYTGSPQLLIFQHDNGVKVIHMHRNCTWNFEFWSFPRPTRCGTTLSCDAGQWQWAWTPGQPSDHKDQ